MIIDCDSCSLRDLACKDCVVSFFLNKAEDSVDLSNQTTEALELLSKIAETAETRRIAAYVRSGTGMASDEQIENRLSILLAEVKTDDKARQEFIDLLELLGPTDPRTGAWRKKLTNTLF